MRKFISFAIVAALCLSFAACGAKAPHLAPSGENGVVEITFDFEKQSGFASNQFAVWIEDMNGALVKTLYATRFTANGGYKNRPDSIPGWVEKSGLAAMAKSEVDAFAGATPKSGPVTYTWDLTKTDGGEVPAGFYRFIVEGSLRWKNRVVYTGVISVGGVVCDAQAQAVYSYEGTDNQPALTLGAPEHAMLGAVRARFIPAGGAADEAD